jgi:hypothetical protein
LPIAFIAREHATHIARFAKQKNGGVLSGLALRRQFGR